MHHHLVRRGRLDMSCCENVGRATDAEHDQIGAALVSGFENSCRRFAVFDNSLRTAPEFGFGRDDLVKLVHGFGDGQSLPFFFPASLTLADNMEEDQLGLVFLCEGNGVTCSP